ncbi:hypothetical protein SOVF_049720 [Spinacia oleracea]|nr:hypothetical protein SOVF_049720 [Spinacia oleracea]
MFAGTSSGGSSSSSFVEPDLMEIPPPAMWKSNSLKKKSNIKCEVVNLDGEDPDDVVIIDEKVAANAKGKKPMLHFLAGDEVMANDGAPFVFEKDLTRGGLSSQVSFIDDDFDFGGLDDDEMFCDKECAMLQAHFDCIDIPSGVEAAVPWWPSGTGSEKQSVISNNSSVFGTQSNSTVGVSDLDQFQLRGSHKPLPFKKSVAANSSSVFNKQTSSTAGTFKKSVAANSSSVLIKRTSSTAGAFKKSVATNRPSVHGKKSSSTIVDQFLPWLSNKPLPPKMSVSVDDSSVLGMQSNSSYPTIGSSDMDQFPWHSHKPLPINMSVSADDSSVLGTQSNYSYSTVGASDMDQFIPWHSHKPSAFNNSAYKNAFNGSKLPYYGFPSIPSYYGQTSGMITPKFDWQLPPGHGPTNQASSNNDYYPFVSQGFANPFVSHVTSSTPFFSGGMTIGPCNDPSVRLDVDISAQILPPCPNGQGDGSENSLVKKLELFKKFDTLEDHSGHLYDNNRESCSQPKSWVNKIADEWRMLERDLPGTIFVRVYEARMDLLRAVIVGADGTPYHNGLFFFDVNFPLTYPNVPPFVRYHAHGLRINPNLYNCGKVCLSLLGTWSGSEAENWRPGKSNMLQVLLSIQGLILNAEPFFNEPGFESSKYSQHGKQHSKNYSENTFLLSLKTMLYTMRAPPKYFEDLVFGHFYMHAHDILAACKAYLDGAEVGSYDKNKSPASEVNGSNCSELLKMTLPTYIKSLVEAFTKIGVKDCEKYLVPVDKVFTRVGSSSRKKIKPLAFKGVKMQQNQATLEKFQDQLLDDKKHQ